MGGKYGIDGENGIKIIQHRDTENTELHRDFIINSTQRTQRYTEIYVGIRV